MEADKIGTAKDLPPIRTLAGWVISAAKDKEYGHLITYPELWEILQVDPQDRRGRSAILKARKTLLLEHKKYLACVDGKGYEIARPAEHADHTRRIRKAGLRKYIMAHRISVNVDIGGLTTEELKTLTYEQTRTGVQLGFMKRIESKRTLKNIEKEAGLMTPKRVAKAISGG